MLGCPGPAGPQRSTVTWIRSPSRMGKKKLQTYPMASQVQPATVRSALAASRSARRSTPGSTSRHSRGWRCLFRTTSQVGCWSGRRGSAGRRRRTIPKHNRGRPVDQQAAPAGPGWRIGRSKIDGWISVREAARIHCTSCATWTESSGSLPVQRSAHKQRWQAPKWLAHQ